MPKTTPAQSAESPSFEQALRELEAIVASMEKGDLDLDPSLTAYQRGMELLKLCQGKLANAEARIRIFDQGQLREADLPDVE